MKVCVLSTGNEVLLGDIVDTNSVFLARGLKEMGIEVFKIMAVGDDLETIVSVLKEISSQVDICLVTGGLGPTQDDLTALACSKACGDRLVMNEKALADMKIYFGKRGYELTRENKKQALLPAGSTMIPNESGTAPGFYIKINRCLFVFMPGVPAEMKFMFAHQVKPMLAAQYHLRTEIFIERLTVFGLGESRVGALLKDFNKYYPELAIGFRADFPIIEVKVMLADQVSSAKGAQTRIQAAKEWVCSQLGRKIVSHKGLSLAQEVAQNLIQKGLTLSVAESCTGGLISNMMTDIDGSSAYFLFSAVTYSNEAKVNVLNVSEKTLIDYGAVHEQTALEMARGARLKAGADVAISTTGIAGPTGGTVEKPVGTVCIGISGNDVEMAKQYHFKFDDRLQNKLMFATMALELLRRQLSQ